MSRRPVALISLFLLIAASCVSASRDSSRVRARVQARPGGPLADVEMAVHAVPVDPPRLSAQEAGLEEEELVLGVLVEGKPVAYPISGLARFEVLNDGQMAPTW